MRRNIFLNSVLAVVLLSALTDSGRAEKNDWAEGSGGQPNGATRDFYNRAAKLPWRQFMGDWTDADGKAHGDSAYATATIEDNDSSRYIEWNVTELVRQWHEGESQNQGFFLREIGAGGTIQFASRESANRRQRPQPGELLLLLSQLTVALLAARMGTIRDRE